MEIPSIGNVINYMDPVILVSGIVVLVAIVLFIPVKGARSYLYQPPSKRFHEADAVLSRRLLTPGSDEYQSYYQIHSQEKETDDRSRQSPGLLSERSRYHHRATFAAARANFEVIDHLGSLTHSTQNESVEPPSPVNPKKGSKFITRWLKGTGAHNVGFAALRDYHLYSHKGRGPHTGEPIVRVHPHAIAITVEMDHEMMQAAPMGSSVMESSEQYLRSGVLALKLAAYIRDMGYEATAHIDGNYEVICPLVAVDAGLGVIGRMGLLMTPDLGPRVRISVVTTNMPVEYSGANPERSTLHFCDLCKKCALNCPAAAIPSEPRNEVDGELRWRINSEKCYHFWTVSGTDCGRCMTVCPYSHPDDAFHQFIRWGIKNNLVFRHLAVKLDDVFYGRKPRIRQLPGWTDITDRT
jgi:ferredoxin